ncbi:mycofactocin system transcriptional regulator [Tomitella cavernea]|uniref:HTH tetR-type domain-containing protein n=1 Tax=Tomitella cavernea TaxID=1387982 RepID=A0ABP9CJA0_9ACTN
MPHVTKPAGRAGRRPSTSADRIGAVGIKLFTEQGFEATSVDEIAETAGIARRTFFRYFPSKNAVPWGDFEGHLARMREGLAALPDGIPLAEGLRRVLIRFNTFPSEEAVTHRRRMALILGEQPLQAYSMLMYTDWRQAIAEYVARRTGMRPDEHIPQSVAWTMLGVALSAYEKWLDNADDAGEGAQPTGARPEARVPDVSGSAARLHALLDEGMRVLDTGVGSLPTAPGRTDRPGAAADAGLRPAGSAYTTR